MTDQGIANDVKKLEEHEKTLANMEQRFARRSRQEIPVTEMDIDSVPRTPPRRTKTPHRQPPGTPCLEAIKRIKKARGTARKMH